ncbi:RNA polymerase sigma factor [Odoribacter sp. AF15-53]|uniref:RNA polymerase sigma factor n=1 Tax=Odoribacter sp. AF15-53 TaxID=2292236 RepID=UPI001F38D797|nr:sigma-70 family RNA polymerase sigma factor [Odoribacter sp. AF15-53]
MRYAGNPDAAKDLLQDGFIKIFTRLDEYTAVGSFEGWMRKIFINCALEKIRQDKFFFFGSGC